MFTRKSIAAIAALPALLAACADTGGVTVHSSYIAADYSYSDVRYNNEGRPSFVEVHNNPFGGTDADRTVAGLMVGKTQGAAIPFSADTALSENYSKFVVYFNPPPGMNGKTACRLDADREGAPQTGSAREVLMSYCIAGRDKAWVRASTDTAASLSDPALEQLIAKAAFDLLPNEFSKRHGSGAGGG